MSAVDASASTAPVGKVDAAAAAAKLEADIAAARELVKTVRGLMLGGGEEETKRGEFDATADGIGHRLSIDRK